MAASIDLSVDVKATGTIVKDSTVKLVIETRCNGVDIEDADITVSASPSAGVTLTPASGTTNSQGFLQVLFKANPNLTAKTEYILTINASKTPLTSASNSVKIPVVPDVWTPLASRDVSYSPMANVVREIIIEVLKLELSNDPDLTVAAGASNSVQFRNGWSSAVRGPK